MDENTKVALRRIFREYYFEYAEKVDVPIRMDEREFGYLSFDGAMIRHLSFRRVGDLRAFLVREAPHSVYYSCAYYFEPTLQMEGKGWKGADLIFDIDADAMDTKCKEEHDSWYCMKCATKGKGRRPSKCPHCGEVRIEEEGWVCDSCLAATKDEAIKLVDFLMEDFGLSSNSIKVYFSGSRGYHVTVEGAPLEGLDQTARNEISDYITGTGLSVESIGLSRRASYDDMLRTLPMTGEPGWRGRIARFFAKREIEGYDRSNKDVREKILFAYGKGTKEFDGFIGEAVKKIGVKIDTMVTTDTHRIFRLPGTLHGSTGLLKKRCEDLLSFDPLQDAVALGEEPLQVYVDHAPSFTLKEMGFGPYKAEKVILPRMAAAYLMGKGLARV